MEAVAIADGVWRWTAPHPDWRPAAPGSSGDWPRDVGCVLHDTGRHAVFIDPLAGDDDSGFWAWAQERCAGRAVVVLTTIAFHERSRASFAERFGASETPPAGVLALPFPELGETMYWLEGPRALVPGDRLLGAGAGELALCPQSWLAYLDPEPVLAQVRSQLRVLLDLPVEAVVVSHGEPVLAGGRGAIARALERA